MPGAYCRYCGHRCFVYREVWGKDDMLVWAGHLATCQKGKDHDRSILGVDAASAVNPIWPAEFDTITDQRVREQAVELYRENREVHGKGHSAAVGATWQDVQDATNYDPTTWEV